MWGIGYTVGGKWVCVRRTFESYDKAKRYADKHLRYTTVIDIFFVNFLGYAIDN